MNEAPAHGRAPRVLLIAEAANPEWVSVPLVGWSLCRALRARLDAHVVTQVRNRPALLRAGLAEGTDFTAIDTERVAGALFRLGRWLRGGADKGWTIGTALASFSYAHFERLLWRAFAGRLRAGEFALVHRITPLSPAIPSRLAGRCARLGIPFVLGPLNGGVAWPPAFRAEQRREREWLSRFRGLHRWFPGYRSTRRHARAILVASRSALAEVPRRWRGKCVFLPENGVDPDQVLPRPNRPARRPLRLITVARLVPLKGIDMLVEAAAPLVREGALALEVVGDGAERSRLAALSEAHGAAAGITFAGQVPRAAVGTKLAQADVFVLPSIREFGGGAVLEAMAAGLPTVVVAYGGPAELVTEQTGVRIPLGPRAAIVRELGAVLRRMADDPAPLAEMGQRARTRALTLYSWGAKAEQVAEVYDWVAGRRAARPTFAFFDADPVGTA
jgi:glycosyltransferase involved in cell wall biosynthesis